jgi:tetratricopeptide (TPR) repeat protein
MDPKELGKLEKLFHAVIEIPRGPERDAAALRLSEGDADLADKALELVASDETAQAANQAANAIAQRDASAPRTYGNYRTVRPLGSGGMGTVYLAERADGQFQQTVAVKVLAPHVAGESFRARFLAERQILADLSHPNITKLLDGGVTPEGTPYLVMEYIDGQPLDVYCDTRRMKLRERLELFLKVCAAVAYAHRRLVVHWDLKPANILVTGEGQPMLLDFGTARLLAEVEADSGAILPLATPRYASPEQRSRAPVATSTDVFSLGVILYELLTGAWPFGDPASPKDMLERLARNSPMKPPHLAVTDDAATARSTSPRSISKSLAGDLASVLAKALAPEADQRYESVQALSADIENWLGGLPVTAKPPGFAYRAGKFLRRHRIPAAATTVFVAGLLTATLYASREARVARARYADLRSLTTTLLFEWKDAINDVPGSTQAQRILVTRVVNSLNQMERQSAKDLALLLDLAEAYRQLGELQGSPYGQNLGDTAGALVNVGKARTLARQQLEADPKNQAALFEAAASARTAGEVHFGIAQTSEAVADLSESAGEFEKLILLSATTANLLECAIAHGVLGDISGQPGTASLRDYKRAVAEYRRAIELDRQALRKDPKFTRAQRGIATMDLKIGDLLRIEDPETALEQYQEGLRTLDAMPREEKNKPPMSRLRAQFLRKTGGALSDLQQWNEAEPYLKQAIAMMDEFRASDPQDNRAKFDVANTSETYFHYYEGRKDWNGALPLAERMTSIANELIERNSGQEPGGFTWRIARGYYGFLYAKALGQMGNPARAAAVGTEALRELGGIADSREATAQSFELASEAFARIEPPRLRDSKRAVRYAEAFVRMRPAGDPVALYHLAVALGAAGGGPAVEAAHKALASLPPPRNGRVPQIRSELEAIH